MTNNCRERVIKLTQKQTFVHLAVFFYGVLFQFKEAKKPVCVKFLKRRFPTLNEMNSTLISNQAKFSDL